MLSFLDFSYRICGCQTTLRLRLSASRIFEFDSHKIRRPHTFMIFCRLTVRMINCQLEPDHRFRGVSSMWKTGIADDVLVTSYHHFTDLPQIVRRTATRDLEKEIGPHQDRVFIYKLGQLRIPQINNIKLHIYIQHYIIKPRVNNNDISK